VILKRILGRALQVIAGLLNKDLKYYQLLIEIILEVFLALNQWLVGHYLNCGKIIFLTKSSVQSLLKR